MEKIGRPKLDKQAARRSRLHVALTEGERVELIDRTTAAGFATLSDFVRAAVLTGNAPAPPRGSGAGIFSADDRRALINIGNNLNQIARVHNMGRDHAMSDELAEALAALNDMFDRYLPA